MNSLRRPTLYFTFVASPPGDFLGYINYNFLINFVFFRGFESKTYKVQVELDQCKCESVE